MHPEFAPVAFIAAASLGLAVPWHWRARNVATLSIIAWLFVCNVIYGVDALIWSDNLRIVVPVWCDITTKLIIGSNIALPASCLCLCIHLERVASTRAAQTIAEDRKRRRNFELLMCFGLPLLYMGIHFIVQGHRFDIIQEYGCRPTTYYSLPAIFLIFVPPLVLAAACLVFAGLALRHFVIRRMTFAAHLARNSALTMSRYIRLIAMAVTEMFWVIAVTSYTLWFNTIAVPIRPWTNWNDVHSDWTRIDLYQTLFTPSIVLTSFYVLWWLVPASTFIFVGFFAFGSEAIDGYKKCFSWIRRRVFRYRSDEEKATIKIKPGVLPLYLSSGKDIKVSTPPTQSTMETPTTASFALSSPPPTYLNDNYSPLHEYDMLSDTSTAVFSHAKSVNDAPPSPSSISSTHTVYPRFELSSIVAPSVLSRQVEPPSPAPSRS
ncbi:Pheromone B beta 1 receptor [Stygiomarasmius scandens]|uniref:Pheromone B beta 1 receptor n=1 Tax=Marasmiellus scandens TaxID=2682957 RepID=A0ABR1IP84_9AGAR